MRLCFYILGLWDSRPPNKWRFVFTYWDSRPPNKWRFWLDEQQDNFFQKIISQQINFSNKHALLRKEKRSKNNKFNELFNQKSRLQAIQSKRISNKTIEPLQNTVATSYLLLFDKWLLQFLNDDKFIINKYDWLETQFLNLVYFTHTPLCRNFIATPLLVPIIIDAVEVLTVSVANT